MTASLSPIGCAIVLAVAALLAAGLLVLRAMGRRRKAARREQLLPLAAAHGATASARERLPETLPVLRSPFVTGKGSSSVLLEGSGGGSTFLLFDADVVVSEKEPGYNFTSVSSGECSTTITAHHTVLAWQRPDAGLPAFRILPVDRWSGDGEFDWRRSAREAGFDVDDPAVAARAEKVASTAGRWVKKLFKERESWEDLRTRTGALAFPDTPELDAAYRVLADTDDEHAVRRLVDRDIADLLLREPGLVVESAGGDWLFVTFNTDARATEPPAGESPGILAPADVDRLLKLGLHLRRRWLDAG